MPSFRSMDANARDEFGCLFCRAGREQYVVDMVAARYSQVEAVAPVKLRYNRHGGMVLEERVTLFPGYVFFKSDRAFEALKLTDIAHVYRLLQYDDGMWALKNADQAIAQRMFECGGEVGFSRAFFEGNQIRIASGALKDYEGQIVRVNRRAKTAQVKIDFCGRELLFWAGYELIDGL